MDSGGKRNTITLICVVFFLASDSVLLAESVDFEQVRKVAETFIRQHSARSFRKPKGLLFREMRVTEVPAIVGFREMRNDRGVVLAHIAELKPRGFVVTSADTDIAPIMAYSFHHSFPNDEDANPLCQMLKQDMQARMQALAMDSESVADEHRRQWNAFPGQPDDPAEDEAFQQWPPENTTATGGWLETIWDQHPPYNALCPLDPVDATRTYVGCVATAFAQIVNYHKRCDFLFGPADSYKTDYGIEIDAECRKYDFPSFEELNAYLVTVQAKYDAGMALDDTDIAALSFACGVAVQMNYSSEGSGAWTADVARVMWQELDFYSGDVTDGLSCELARVLQENLINGLPALLTIREPNALRGHAIVCDGYNTKGEYHLNFGWGAERPDTTTEAWYRLPVHMPTFLSVLTGAIVNIQPGEPAIEVEPASLLFLSSPERVAETQTLRIKSNKEGMMINAIYSPEGFLIAHADDGAFSDRLESFALGFPGQELAIEVKFHPDTPRAYHGALTIEYDNNHVRHVMLEGNAFAGGTEIAAGAVAGRWSLAGSPYFVSGDVVVQKDGMLMVDPGVQVMFVGPYSMTVGPKARLVATGTASYPVAFTAWNRDGGWTGLRFIESGNDDILRHCGITLAKKGTGIVDEVSESSQDSTLAFEGVDPNSLGGAICCYYSDPTIINCEITNNAGSVAGAIYCYESSLSITNTLIANNSCTGGTPQCGGIFAEVDSVPAITNCTIANNAPGGLFSASWGGMDVTNTILWGNDDYQIEVYQSGPNLRFCDVQGGYPGEGNIDADPCFFDPSSDVGIDSDGAAAIWSLRSTSPCTNSGTNVGLPQMDLGGNLRLYGGAVDIGAYESQFDLPLITILPSTTLDAGFVSIGTESLKSMEIRNTGGRDVVIEHVEIAGDMGGFYLVAPTQDLILPPDDSVHVQVGFLPAEPKTYEGTLHIYSSASNGVQKSVSLHGIGVAGTVVPGGAVSGIWARDQSPLTVIGDIFIPVEQSLRIEPGVFVQFAGRFSFTIGFRATLEARGRPDGPIVFTARDAQKGWMGIRFVNTEDDDVLQCCIVEYAKKPRTEGGGYLNLLGGGILCCGSPDMAPGFYVPSSPWIDHCLIRNNHGNVGGGIMITDNSDAVITYCRIIDNSTDSYGGGLFIYAALGTVANNIIAHNSGNVSGGIASWYAFPLIVNNTIVHNRPNGLYLDSTEMAFWGAVPIVNNIIWENELYLTESVWPSEYMIHCNDMQGGWIGQGNFDADPLFADAESRDYHLKSQAGRWDPNNGSWVTDEVTSPCIDAGDPDIPFGQEPAPHGNRLNMGAYGGTPEASKSP